VQRGRGLVLTEVGRPFVMRTPFMCCGRLQLRAKLFNFAAVVNSTFIYTFSLIFLSPKISHRWYFAQFTLPFLVSTCLHMGRPTHLRVVCMFASLESKYILQRRWHQNCVHIDNYNWRLPSWHWEYFGLSVVLYILYTYLTAGDMEWRRGKTRCKY
jgi:hypothetical protein